jgi:hypothetical protein
MDNHKIQQALATLRHEAAQHQSVEKFIERMKTIFKKANSVTMRAGEMQAGLLCGSSNLKKSEERLYYAYRVALWFGKYQEKDIFDKARGQNALQ